MTRHLPPLGPGLVRLGAELPAQVSPEGHLLTRCATAGVAIPVGAVLLDGAAGLGPLRPGEHVTLRALGTAVAVRVSTDDTPGLASELLSSREAPGRSDLLVLRAVASVHAGRAQVGADRPYDVALAVEGEAYAEAGAEIRTLLVPRLAGRWQRAHRGADPWRTPMPPWGMRLARLLRDVRRVLGPGERELRWADDGRACRLVGAVDEMGEGSRP